MLSFNPKLNLRKAMGGIFCYEINPKKGGITYQKLLHPLEAVLLCLFNGKRTIKTISELLNQLTGASIVKTELFINNFIKEYREYLVNGKVNNKYNPADFVISKEQLENTQFRLLSPVILVMLLTYKCTSNCLYCYANRNSIEDRNEMNYDMARHIVDLSRESGIELMYIGGGDPFTRSWIIDLIRYVKNNNIEIMISTKEYLSKEKCKALVDTGIEHIQISIDSLNNKTAELLTGRCNFVDEVMKSIDNLQESGIEVTTNSVITKYNYRDIPQLIEFLISKDIKNMILSRYARTIYKHSDALFVDDNDILWVNEQLDMINRPKEVQISYPQVVNNNGDKENQLKEFLKRASCSFGRTGLTVSPSGKVIPCESLPTIPPFVVGNLAEQSIDEVWNSDKLHYLFSPKKSHFIGTACYDCEHFKQCIYRKGWCIRDIYKVYRSSKGVQPSCPMSTHNMRLM